MVPTFQNAQLEVPCGCTLDMQGVPSSEKSTCCTYSGTEMMLLYFKPFFSSIYTGGSVIQKVQGGKKPFLPGNLTWCKVVDFLEAVVLFSPVQIFFQKPCSHLEMAELFVTCPVPCVCPCRVPRAGSCCLLRPNRSPRGQRRGQERPGGPRAPGGPCPCHHQLLCGPGR